MPFPRFRPDKPTARGRKSSGWDPAATLAGLRLLGTAAALAAAVLGWRALEAGLLAHARAEHGAAVGDADVSLRDAPAWVAARPALAARIRAAVAEVVPADPFDGAGLARAAARLAEDPWVAAVAQVRRTPAGIEVEADWREPVALVRARDGYHVVDAGGRRLEGPADRFGTGAGGELLPVIVGVSQPPPARAGDRWAGAEVDAGLSLVARLRGEAFAPQIEAYDVGQRDPRTGRLSLVLRTDAGSVVWGRPADAPFAASEVSTEEKVRRLHQLADAYRGRIDAGGRVIRIYGERMQYDERSEARAATAGAVVGAGGARGLGHPAAYGPAR
ncbi:cell division protein FtsQ/DivIB [Phycisphaera mikurensis]|uniref:POTRA domain-containing protein n=1 Tax=Phycisphaera mikurensis (strain NBRC 102666 / KCTC 22515 / FYK2301M01) TaxID=1142394 RepID=I0IAI9_PHYMF|nr:hypothetical protein [Phycisphaera mikurensis]MBB6441726.1 hypothetical protein [Phycisphaera mikurensis]BAM02277.1 hypothetical protein PSMK_01180 [Phycisphaera mikurensis NBRC 102666]